MPPRHFLLRIARKAPTIREKPEENDRETRLGVQVHQRKYRQRKHRRRSRFMTRKSALFGLVALLASVAPAMAGEVYVPFTSNRSIEGTTYRTKVWVTNTGTAGRRFETRFIAQGADGTQGIGNTTPVSVPGGGTGRLTNVARFARGGRQVGGEL